MPDPSTTDESAFDERSLSRRERERLRRRRAMLRAAQSVFAEKGYAQATLDEIAERAEFGKGTLYNYFEGGKEEILFAVFERIFDHVYDMLNDAFAVGASETVLPLRERYRAFAEAYVSFFQEREDLFMVLIKEAHRSVFSSDAERAAYFKRHRERLIDTLVPLLEEARTAGRVRDLPVEAIAHMLLSNTERMQAACAMQRSGVFDEDDANGDACLEKQALMNDPRRAANFLTTILFDGLTRA